MSDLVTPEAGPPLLPTHELTWDALEAFLDGLLERLQRLPGAGPRLVSSSRYGRGGDDQEGIDHQGVHDDGSTITWQCKATTTLGPAAVREIIAKTEVEADRHVIVYGRPASAAARRELRSHDGWAIWDQRDLTNKVRALPPHEARRLVDDHFGVDVRRRILPGVGDAVVSVEEAFGPLLEANRVFHHRAQLVGRSDALAQLEAAMAAEGSQVIVLSGPGGSGKSRLVLDALRGTAEQRPARPLVVAGGIAPLDAGVLTELPGCPAVVVLEDGQRDMDGVRILLGYTPQTQGTTLVITCRPSAVPAIREAAIQAHLDSTQIHIMELPPLDLPAARQLVRELAADTDVELNDDFAEALALGSRDCPLVAVVAVSMIAAGTLTTGALSLDAGFRQEILDRFGDVMRTGIPGISTDQAADYLAIVAVLSPVNLTDQALFDAIAGFLGIPRAEVLARAEALADHGVLLERDKSVRVVPDVLGDESLSRAAVRHGVPTGYVERVWDAFEQLKPMDVALNLAQLDWRVQSENGPDLLAGVWEHIEARVLRLDARGRREWVATIQALAATQPARVVHLIEVLMADRSADSTPYPMVPNFTITDDDVRKELAPALGVCATVGDPATTERALDLLWGLARQDPRLPTEPEHPLRVLKDLVSFDRRESDRLRTAAVEAATRWLAEPSGDDDTTTPLKVLEPLVAKAGVRPQWDPDRQAVNLIPFHVQPAAVADLRAAIRRIAVDQSSGSDLRRAVDAIDLLEDALRQPAGYFGNEVSHEDIQQWHDEDDATLDALTAISRATDEPLVRLRLRAAVSWQARHGTQVDLVTKARSLIVELDRHDGDLLTSAILGGAHEMVPREAEFLTGASEPADDDLDVADARHADERRSAVQALWQDSNDDPAIVIARLDERLRATVIAGRTGDGAAQVMQAVVETRPEQARALVHSLQATDEGPLDEYVHILLEAVREPDPATFADLLSDLLDDRDTLAAGMLRGFYFHNWCVAAPATTDVLERGLGHQSESVRHAAIRSARDLLRRAPRDTATWMLPHARAAGYAALHALDDAADHDFHRWLDQLSDDDRLAILKLLVAIRRWDDWRAQQLLTALAGRLPAAVLDALITDVINVEPIVENLDGLAQQLAPHPDALQARLAHVVGLETEQRWALGYLMPNLLGDPITNGAAQALRGLAEDADAEHLDRLAELLVHCESLVPSQLLIVETLLDRAQAYGEPTLSRVRQSLLNSAIPVITEIAPDESSSRAALKAQIREVAERDDLSETVHEFYVELAVMLAKQEAATEP